MIYGQLLFREGADGEVFVGLFTLAEISKK